ncbi:hypothetical protein [Acinetobacter sp. YH01009]|uniref:hypothetical protein n=1 Tax=Acinetobacter sp. YH01009 TaxID=2601025 RepID=UPI0015D0D863|nr:hypothetical protein [Acinetobacter sp. YH01009]
MVDNPNTSKEIRNLDVLNSILQKSNSSIRFLRADIQNLIDNLESAIFHKEIVTIISKLGEELYRDKIINVSYASNYFDIGLEFLETHFKLIGSNTK